MLWIVALFILSFLLRHLSTIAIVINVRASKRKNVVGERKGVEMASFTQVIVPEVQVTDLLVTPLHTIYVVLTDVAIDNHQG